MSKKTKLLGLVTWVLTIIATMSMYYMYDTYFWLEEMIAAYAPVILATICMTKFVHKINEKTE